MMKIKESCDNCKWDYVCRQGAEVGAVCDEYELDMFSDDYVDELIEKNRKEYRQDYVQYIWEMQC